jgi:hypothetical protein
MKGKGWVRIPDFVLLPFAFIISADVIVRNFLAKSIEGKRALGVRP